MSRTISAYSKVGYLGMLRLTTACSQCRLKSALHLTSKQSRLLSTSMPSKDNVELLQGTLDLIVLRSLATMGPLHAYALANRLEQVSEHALELNQGTLYPALVRLEQRGWIKGSWGKTESNREAKFYEITGRGAQELERQTEKWLRLTGFVGKLLSTS